mmetsp:Transcript_21487/g.54082  ORF Transcript_21487/g.54082 Transcript_21487/m.54082 type:complete len:594 (+) Transcript_21487:488-2269(+)|eukprot:CAMPEP_0178998106 /NCGR_PEP_ID=MMETSP0795-20121207/9342_1 /TAXON_ID=88552 /ORGANISM="Amoebophrya sp., Strain Ameob2" /LENGTH=593 /DNA_ID=CAMNT_0020690775 /DNA_START=464 /DNA_END=2245 /DNA_ORIENTATION=+
MQNQPRLFFGATSSDSSDEGSSDEIETSGVSVGPWTGGLDASEAASPKTHAAAGSGTQAETIEGAKMFASSPALSGKDVEQPQFFRGAPWTLNKIATLPYSSGIAANPAQSLVLWVEERDPCSVRFAPSQHFADAVNIIGTADSAAISFLSVTDAYTFIGTDTGCLRVYRTAEDLGSNDLSSLSKPIRTETSFSARRGGRAVVSAFANEHGTCCVILASGEAFLMELETGGSSSGPPPQRVADPSKLIKCGAFVSGRQRHDFELLLGSALKRTVFIYTGTTGRLEQCAFENWTGEFLCSPVDGSGWVLAGVSSFGTPSPSDRPFRGHLHLFFICECRTTYQGVGRLAKDGQGNASHTLTVLWATRNLVAVESAADPRCCYFAQIPGVGKLEVSAPAGTCLRVATEMQEARRAAQEPLQDPPLVILRDSSQRVSLHFGDGEYPETENKGLFGLDDDSDDDDRTPLRSTARGQGRASPSPFLSSDDDDREESGASFGPVTEREWRLQQLCDELRTEIAELKRTRSWLEMVADGWRWMTGWTSSTGSAAGAAGAAPGGGGPSSTSHRLREEFAAESAALRESRRQEHRERIARYER